MNSQPIIRFELSMLLELWVGQRGTAGRPNVRSCYKSPTTADQELAR